MPVTDHAPGAGSAESGASGQLSRTERADQRIHARQVVAWHASILISKSRKIACVVLNVSAGGARLRLRDAVDLPGSFTLSIDRFGYLPVELLDQAQKEIRVAFLDDPERVRKLFRHSLPIFRDAGKTA